MKGIVSVILSFLIFSFFSIVSVNEIFSEGNKDNKIKIVKETKKPAAAEEDEDEEKENPNAVEEDSFYISSLLVNMPSGVMLKKKWFELEFLHRFRTDLKDSDAARPDNMMGLYNGGNVAFNLSYGLTKDMMAGVNFLSYNQSIEYYVQYSPMQQFKMDDMDFVKNSYLSIALRAGVSTVVRKQVDGDMADLNPSGSFQAVISKRLIPKVHVYLIPGVISKAYYSRSQNETISTMGFGVYYALFGLESRYRICAEYTLPLPGYDAYSNSWGFAFHMMTGKHLFALTLANTTGTNLSTAAQAPEGNEIHFGFNMSRLFSFAK